MKRTSEVCLDSIAISTKRRERVSPTDTKNRSSGSWNTRSSSSAGRPRRWRQTSWGRIAAS